MGRMERISHKLTSTGFAVGMLAEAEKILLGGSIRTHLDGIAQWPFIYTSNLGLTIPAALLVTTASRGLGERYGSWIANNTFTRPIENIDTLPVSKRIPHKMGRYMVACCFCTLPVGVPAVFEMMDKCDVMSAEEREINACRPDPVDATIGLLGGAVAMVAVLESERAQEPKVPLPVGS